MFTFEDVMNAIPEANIIQRSDRQVFTAASIDSRTIAADALFFAIKGPNHDGHDYVNDVLQKSAPGGVVVSKAVPPTGSAGAIIQVPDTLEALQKLAYLVRRKYNPTVIAVTGSAGKTTTKDMIAYVLGKFFATQKSQASFNNQYGVPLSILALNSDTTHLVLELGANHHGEIEALSRLAAPDVGVLTNIGYAHIGNFGSLEGTLKAKLELLQHVRDTGSVILNGDDPLLKKNIEDIQQNGLEVFSVGETPDNTFSISELVFSANGMKGVLSGYQECIPLQLAAGGAHMVNAALLSVAVLLICRQMKLSELPADLFEAFRSPGGRFKIELVNSNTWVIDDTYNSSPDAMLMALRSLELFNVTQRIAVLGEMKELGTYHQECHERVGCAAVHAATHLVVTSPDIASAARENGFPPERIFEVPSAAEALQVVKKLLEMNPDQENVVLAKGSRLTHMERVVLGLSGCQVTCSLTDCQKYINCKNCPELAKPVLS